MLVYITEFGKMSIQKIRIRDIGIRDIWLYKIREIGIRDNRVRILDVSGKGPVRDMQLFVKKNPTDV